MQMTTLSPTIVEQKFEGFSAPKLRQKNFGIFSDLGRSLKNFLKANTISEIFLRDEKIRAQLRAQKVLFIYRGCYARRALFCL